MSRDFYQILQVDPKADAEVVEAAYRRLARKFHPDLNPGAESERRMRELNEAYAVLGDPQARAAYDRERAAGPTAGPVREPFGGSPGPTAPAPPPVVPEPTAASGARSRRPETGPRARAESPGGARAQRRPARGVRPARQVIDAGAARSDRWDGRTTVLIAGGSALLAAAILGALGAGLFGGGERAAASPTPTRVVLVTQVPAPEPTAALRATAASSPSPWPPFPIVVPPRPEALPPPEEPAPTGAVRPTATERRLGGPRLPDAPATPVPPG